MSTMDTRKWPGLARLGVGAMAVVAALGLWSPGAARADSFIPLPNGHINGPGVRIVSTGESAKVSPSLAANGAGRTAWVSGNVTVDLVTPNGAVGPNNGAQNNPGTNDSSTHGSSGLTVGYIVGCQVSLGNLSAGAGFTITNPPSVLGAVSFPLSPGSVTWVQIDNIDMTKSGTYHLNYQDFDMNVQGCAGYAQARQFSVVEVIGADYSKTTLYGQPFTLG
ncbi:MspA family porin [Nocardia sp. NEAU-G5]|uniref:MspA family porin n=1 Tax=Nocardia albiluteola TaxID=2842303 RepID=A0ABS6AUV8_9NOCA|nr:MspA family porin [Nocardia albiluteola]MBU3061802.1 MspA family porin [Nocardia albiluteola]